MGAERVEAVADPKHASSSQDLSKYDYVVVKEQHEVRTVGKGAKKCVPFSWVKECLVAGRFLPAKN